MVMNAEAAGKVEAGESIKLNIPLHAQESDAHLARFLKSIVEQFESISLTLVVGVDADGAESPGRLACAIVENEFGLAEHHMANDVAVLFHHKVEFGDEIGIVPELVEHKMLSASGAVNVPECFAGEVVYLVVIAGLL